MASRDLTPPGAETIAANPDGPPRSAGGVVLCLQCRRGGACRLGIRNERVGDDGVMRYDVVSPAAFAGAAEAMHGGWTASVLDEVLGHVPFLVAPVSLTATLTVNYPKPVPVEQSFVALSWVERQERSKWWVSGELVSVATGDVVADATGLYIATPPSGRGPA